MATANLADRLKVISIAAWSLSRADVLVVDSLTKAVQLMVDQADATASETCNIKVALAQGSTGQTSLPINGVVCAVCRHLILAAAGW